MGYYTTFTLRVIGNDEDVKKAEHDISMIDSQCKELVEEGYVYSRWYDWQEDLSQVAKNNPNVLIMLSGDGESSEDLWEARFKGDQFEQVIWEMPPFTNKELLTESELFIMNNKQ